MKRSWVCEIASPLLLKGLPAGLSLLLLAMTEGKELLAMTNAATPALSQVSSGLRDGYKTELFNEALKLPPGQALKAMGLIFDGARSPSLKELARSVVSSYIPPSNIPSPPAATQNQKARQGTREMIKEAIPKLVPKLPILAYAVSRTAYEYNQTIQRDHAWSRFIPTITVTPGGIYVTLATGGQMVLPANLSTDPATVARLQQDYPQSSAYNAAWIAASVAATGALARALGFSQGKEPWLKDLLLNFTSGYVLGSAFNQGRLHRDIAIGGINGINFSLANAMIAWVNKEPIPDIRHGLIAFSAVYAVKGSLPQHGAPIFSNGWTTGSMAINAATDMAFAGIWDGIAGAGTFALQGKPHGQGFQRGMLYGAIAKGLHNAVFGARMRVSPQILEDSRRWALEKGGIDISKVQKDFELRRGGLLMQSDFMDMAAITSMNWITTDAAFQRNRNLSELLAHEYAHAWATDRIGMQFGMWIFSRYLIGEDPAYTRYENLPYYIF